MALSILIAFMLPLLFYSLCAQKNKEKSKQNFLPTKDKDKSWWKNKEEFLEKTLAWEIDGL